MKDQAYTLRINDYSGEYLSASYTDVMPNPEPYQYILQKPQAGSFVGVGNSFVVSEETVIPGKYFNYRLNYKNNGKQEVQQALLEVTVPTEVEDTEDSVRLDGKKVVMDNNGQITIQNVKPGQREDYLSVQK